VQWNQVTLIGVGLLGGSLGLALRQYRLAATVVGYVRRPASIRECERAGAVDHATLELRAAVAGADLIVLCTPLAQIGPLSETMLDSIKRGAIVTDVGSVKTSVVKALETLVAGAGGHFVGGHPMAGAEKTGVNAARPDLFRNAVCVITPTAKSNRAAVGKVERLWKAVGSRVLRLTPELHDELVSRSSHLPHVIAAQLASCVLDPAYPKSQPLLCANGFRDTTRIASGSPEMWCDIAMANRKNLIRALDVFSRQLQDFRRKLQESDAAAITSFFEKAKRRRDDWSQHPGSPSPE